MNSLLFIYRQVYICAVRCGQTNSQPTIDMNVDGFWLRICCMLICLASVMWFVHFIQRPWRRAERLSKCQWDKSVGEWFGLIEHYSQQESRKNTNFRLLSFSLSRLGKSSHHRSSSFDPGLTQIEMFSLIWATFQLKSCIIDKKVNNKRKLVQLNSIMNEWLELNALTVANLPMWCFPKSLKWIKKRISSLQILILILIINCAQVYFMASSQRNGHVM